jgi:hypothetical protein
MFLPFSLRGMQLENRVVVSPMSMYSAEEGLPSDWHLVHYGALAQGGAGLVYTEMTNVSPEARITTGCAGIWNAEQEAAWAALTPPQMARRLKELEKQMYEHARNLEFEEAARVRDRIRELQGKGLAA